MKHTVPEEVWELFNESEPSVGGTVFLLFLQTCSNVSGKLLSFNWQIYVRVLTDLANYRRDISVRHMFVFERKPGFR